MLTLRSALVATALLGLAACQSIPAVPPGPMKLGATEAELSREWSDVSVLLPGANKKVKVLSIDGPLLNRLYVTDGLAVGESLVKTATKEQPTPKLRAGMNSSERMEFVADSIAAMGYQRVETSRPRPAKFGAQTGVRFDLIARTEEGLDVKGTALAAEAGGKSYFVIYIAPGEHYFQANLPDAEAVMASARPKA